MKYGRMIVAPEIMMTLLGFEWDTTAKIIGVEMINNRINFIVLSDNIKTGVDKLPENYQEVPLVIPITELRSKWENDDVEDKVIL